MRRITLILLTVFTFSSCTFFNLKQYKKVSKELIESIMQQDYEKSYEILGHNRTGEVDKETFASQIDYFREFVIENFTEDYKLKFASANKVFFKTGEKGQHPFNMIVQIESDTHFGYFTITFSDNPNVVLNIDLQDYKERIPPKGKFYLFGILPFLVVALNIFTIIRVVKSQINRKWLKIIGVILLNVPTFTYSLMNGFSFSLVQFQFFFGAAIGLFGYAGTYLSFGLPIGAFLANYKIDMEKQKLKEEQRKSQLS